MKRNGGFSLVELIVVVLIMGVISVALAPQVVKWVKVSEVNSEEAVRRIVVSVAQTALAEYEKDHDSHTMNYNITSAGPIPQGNDEMPGFVTILEEVFGGDYPSVPNQSGKVFQIQINTGSGLKINAVAVSGTY